MALPDEHPGLSNPATAGAAVSVSDSVNMANPSRAIYVGTTGNVSLLTTGGSSLVFVAVPAGFILPVRTVRVNSTNTNASNMVALY